MRNSKDNKIAYTFEFYPEEGKYHYTGHRNCKVVYSPRDTKEKGKICPVCGKSLTVGVMERVEALSEREENVKAIVGKTGVSWSIDPAGKHPPFAKLVPLIEIIAEVLESNPLSLKVKALFDSLVLNFGSELEVLLKTPINEIEKSAAHSASFHSDNKSSSERAGQGEKLANSILKVRNGKIFINPGYDGEYGVVKIDGLKEVPEVLNAQPSLEI